MARIIGGIGTSLGDENQGRTTISYVFDLERSARGLRLNRFLHSLGNQEKRKLFLEKPEAAMKGLSEEEKQMVRRLETLEDFLKTRRVPGAR